MQDEARRKDTAMAHHVQCGITLANIAGIVSNSGSKGLIYGDKAIQIAI